jgi:hypothetical protein
VIRNARTGGKRSIFLAFIFLTKTRPSFRAERCGYDAWRAREGGGRIAGVAFFDETRTVTMADGRGSHGNQGADYVELSGPAGARRGLRR